MMYRSYSDSSVEHGASLYMHAVITSLVFGLLFPQVIVFENRGNKEKVDAMNRKESAWCHHNNYVCCSNCKPHYML